MVALGFDSLGGARRIVAIWKSFNMQLKNLTGKTVTMISTTFLLGGSRAATEDEWEDEIPPWIVAEWPPERGMDPVTIIQEDSGPFDPIETRWPVPVVTAPRYTGIYGLEGVRGHIIVTPEVAVAMRILGIRHRARVYSPGPVVTSTGNPNISGSLGFTYHPEVSIYWEDAS